MEVNLIEWAKEVRDQDLMVETWMLEIEGRKLLTELYPWKLRHECKL